MKRLMYKPVGLLLGAAAGIIAGAVFKQVWHLTSGEDEVPRATDIDRRWGEILLAAAVQGAIFAGVKAAVDRAGAKGVQKLTGTWPD